MASFSEINKRGGSNKACSWENFLKKNKKNSMLIRDFRVHIGQIYTVEVSQNFVAFSKYSYELYGNKLDYKHSIMY